MGFEEGIFGWIKTLTHFTRNPQVSVELIGPRVIRASKDAPVAALFHTDSGPTMTANIEKYTNFALLIPRDNQGLCAIIKQKEVARIGHLTNVTDPNPAGIPIVANIVVINHLRGIKISLQGHAVDIFFQQSRHWLFAIIKYLPLVHCLSLQ